MKKLDLNSTPVLPQENHDSAVNDQTVSQQGDSVVESPDVSGLESDHASMKKTNFIWVAVVLVISISLGVITGFGASKLYSQNKPASSNQQITQVAKEGEIKAGDIFGSEDDNFKDEAEGYLEAGGIDGEGSHKLLRPGGASQTVYLTSSVTDLDKFVGMEVKVYGETYQGQKAGWLMDVGKVKVINPQAEKPATEE